MRKIVLLFLILIPIRNTYSQAKVDEKIDSLIKVLKTASEDTTKVNALNALAYEFRSSDPDTAIYFANAALDLATKAKYQLGLIGAYLWKGAALMFRGEYEEALKNNLEALKISDQLYTSESAIVKFRILKLKSNAYNNTGIIYFYRADYPEALKNQLSALKIRKEIEDKEGIAASYNNIGLIYNDMGNYPEALNNHLAALKIHEERGNKRGIANCYNNLGTVYRNQGNYTEALTDYLACLKIREEIGGAKRDIAGAYNNIGVVYSDQGNHSEALKNYLASLRIREETGDKLGMAGSYSNIGSVYHNLGNNPEALMNYFNSLEIYQELGSNDGLTSVYYNIAGVYFSQKKNSEAYSYFNKSLLLAKDIGSPDDIQKNYLGLATLDSAEGNFRQALEHFKLYITFRDSLFNEENTKKLVQSQMQYEFDKKESLAKVEQEKKDAIAAKELQKQKLLRNGFVGGFAVVLLFAGVFFTQRNRIKKGKKRSDELLLNILPQEVAEELEQKGSTEPQQFDDVTVMFTDFKDFTQISEKLSPVELVTQIHYCYKAFDGIMGKYNIEKIKTIGDSYMAAGGLPVRNKTNATDVVKAALEIQRFMDEDAQQKRREGKEAIEIRIGVHSGPVVAGIVGIKKFAYDIWGDTVNIASRMESSGEAGKVNISGSTYELVKDQFKCIYRGKIQAKHKGEIDMYFVEDHLK